MSSTGPRAPDGDGAVDSTPQRPGDGAATLTFRGGGWVIALAGVLVLLLLVWSLLGPILGHRPVGDGRALDSYGFDLSNLAVARETLVPSGNPRGFLPSLDRPAHLRGADMAVYNERSRSKYVVSTDRVAGIVVNGHAHAWPLSLLNVHEVVNDVVGGVPVAATYSPLCDAFVAFDRRIGGKVRLLEVSGLLVDSNLVAYDKGIDIDKDIAKDIDKGIDTALDGDLDEASRAADAPPGADARAGAAAATSTPHVPSIFLQLERRAIAGPLATGGGTRLEVLPGACITTWADWLAAHPDTTVAERDPDMIRRMKEINYARYFLTPRLEFPAAPLPSDAELAAKALRLKSPVLAIRGATRWTLVPIEDLVATAGPARRAEIEVEGMAVRIDLPSGPAVARAARVDGGRLEVVPCLYFAAEAVLGPFEPTEILRTQDR